jgi:ribosomal-protein-alanine N-acetyltransferase
MSDTVPPTLLTPRLELRAFRPDDLDALAAIYADPEVMRYIRGGVSEGPRSREQTATSMDAYAEEWAQHGYGVWAVVNRADGLLLGVCGFVDRAEIGYIFGRASWGRGIATEAARACLWYGFERLGYEEIGAGAKRENVASLRVIEKLGMRHVANDYFDLNGGAYYHLSRDDYILPSDTSLAQSNG